jgi:hypothetical protein
MFASPADYVREPLHLVLERAQLLDIVPLRVSHSPDLAEEVGTAPLG